MKIDCRFNSILIVGLVACTLFLFQANDKLFTDARCVMREPCSARSELAEDDNPLTAKWYNCLNQSDPEPLQSEKTRQVLEKLCPNFYVNSRNERNPAVCCSDNQVTVLKEDLARAEGILAQCPSCYFNFRMLWCHMTCSPQQHEFIIPRESKRLKYTDFSAQMAAYENVLKGGGGGDDDENDEDGGEDEGDAAAAGAHETDQENNENHGQEHTTTTAAVAVETTTAHVGEEEDHEHHEQNADETANNEEEKEESKRRRRRRRRRQTHHDEEEHHPKIDVLTSIIYYLREESVSRLVDSCRGVKLADFDALQTVCGRTSKECNSQYLTNYLGLEVEFRPFDIYFQLATTPTVQAEIEIINNTLVPPQRVRKTELLKPVLFETHRCNESYSYGDLEQANKCSCKDCSDSCEFTYDFSIPKKHVFMIGSLDGVSVVMAILFVIFLIVFIKTLVYFGNDKHKLTKCGASYKKASILRVPFNKLLKSKTPANETTNQNGGINHDASVPDYKCTQSRLVYPRRLHKIQFLEHMRLIGHRLEVLIQKKFKDLGDFCTTYRKLVLLIGTLVCSLMCLGFFNFTVEKDPVQLWSHSSSVARQHKKYFDDNFNPFYRIAQLIIEPKAPENSANSNETVPALTPSVLNETFHLYKRINTLVAKCTNCDDSYNVVDVRLQDICFQPLEPENNNCATQSIYQYWKNDETRFLDSLKPASDESYIKHLQLCMTNPFEPGCISAFGAPMQPYMVVGGFTGDNYLNATALVITFVIRNFQSNKQININKAMAWEAEALALLKNYTSPLIDVSFSTERSIEDELERESKADIKIIAISYVMMFVYLALTLGKYSKFSLKVILVEMKVILGLAGVILVLISVFSSGGFFMYLGVPATLITLEVIPFLLLAVGVDNIYVMVQTYQNDERGPNERVEDQIARIVGKVGPSMLLTGTTQSVSFLISALTPMPGVRAFSLYASLAIILNFIMQITCFIVLLTLDAKRERAKRIDVLCCIKVGDESDDGDANHSSPHRKSFLHTFFKTHYTPFLLKNNKVRAAIIVLFIGFFFASISMCVKLKVGLDQKLAMPSDSYQIKYFEALQKNLAVGPPVYFVLKNGFDYTNSDVVRRLCGGQNCDQNSLQTLISQAALRSNETYIAQASVNWLDDYFTWLNKQDGQCCFTYANQSTRFCDFGANYESACQRCDVQTFNKTDTFPDRKTFLGNLEFFLKQNPSENCPKAGHALHGSAVKLVKDPLRQAVASVGPSHFMAYHTVLSTSDDFVNAMMAAHKIADAINKELNKDNAGQKLEVFPYSIFYVFYEQYLTIWQDATMQLILTLFAIFISSFILLSFDLYTALIITVLIAIIIIDMVGIMFWWNIELNAISLVNLVIAIGISVEFSAHIARAFATSDKKTRIDRASEALCTMGPPVFSGVVQSIVGISVLAFAHSQLFQVFYFRMYFSILMLGLTHGLIFLPVLLSYIGTKKRFTQGPSSLKFPNEPIDNLSRMNSRMTGGGGDDEEAVVNGDGGDDAKIPGAFKETNLNEKKAGSGGGLLYETSLVEESQILLAKLPETTETPLVTMLTVTPKTTPRSQEMNANQLPPQSSAPAKTTPDLMRRSREETADNQLCPNVDGHIHSSGNRNKYTKLKDHSDHESGDDLDETANNQAANNTIALENEVTQSDDADDERHEKHGDSYAKLKSNDDANANQIITSSRDDAIIQPSKNMNSLGSVSSSSNGRKNYTNNMMLNADIVDKSVSSSSLTGSNSTNKAAAAKQKRDMTNSYPKFNYIFNFKEKSKASSTKDASASATAGAANNAKHKFFASQNPHLNGGESLITKATKDLDSRFQNQLSVNSNKSSKTIDSVFLPNPSADSTSQQKLNSQDLTDDDRKAIIDSTSDDITESEFFNQIASNNSTKTATKASYKPLPEIVIDANGGVSFNGLEHSDENEDDEVADDDDDSNNILSKSLSNNKHQVAAGGMAAAAAASRVTNPSSNSKSSELIDRLKNLKPKSSKNRAKSSSLSTNKSGVKEETY